MRNIRNKKIKIECNYIALIIILAVLHWMYFLKAGNILSVPNSFTVLTFLVTWTGIIILSITSKRINEQQFLVLSFVILFTLYILRTPEDTFSNYLWAEDGNELIQDSIYKGIPSLLERSNGTIWFIPRLIGIMLYWVADLTGRMSLLPMVQGIIIKATSVVGVMYFLGNRFSWIVKDRSHRLVICALIILLMPQNGADFFTCDTSLHFMLNIPVFLIGLDHICRPDTKQLNYIETIFLFLMTITTAAFIIVFIVGVVSELRWCIYVRRNHRGDFECIKELPKLLLLLVGSAIQFNAIFSSERGNIDLELIDRIKIVTVNFPLLPYLQNNSIVGLLIGIIFWACLLSITAISKKVFIYGIAYSYAFLMYCSFTNPVSNVLNGVIRTGRYELISYMAISLLIGIAIFNINIKGSSYKIVSNVLLAVVIILGILTFRVETIGAEYAIYYDKYIDMYDSYGTERIEIPIGPWTPQTMGLPVSIKNEESESDGIVLVNYIEGEEALNTVSVNSNKTHILVQGGVPLKKTEGGSIGECRVLCRLIDNEYSDWYFVCLTDNASSETENVSFFVYIPMRFVHEGKNTIEVMLESPDKQHWSSSITYLDLHLLP